MTWSTDPSKNIFKNQQQKIQNKAVQSNILRHINKVTPHLTFMRRAQNADTHATQTASAVPKYFPSLLQFCTGYRI